MLGSYQLLNVLEVVYMSVVPFAVLAAFGAGPAGVYAVATRVVSSARLLHEAFLPPLLSAGASVFASGSADRMRDLIVQAFRATMGLSMIPLGCVAAFGATIVYVWTGQTDPSLGPMIGLISLAALFQSLSLLALVLYRSSGSAMYDNVRQVFRIVLIVGVALLARSVGLFAVIFGMAVVEFVGVVLMIFALKRTFPKLPIGRLFTDFGRFSLATGLIAGTGALALVSLGDGATGRSAAFLQLVLVSIGSLVVAYPIAAWTGVVTPAERSAFLGALHSRVKWGRAKAA